MVLGLFQKIIKNHLIEGKMIAGEDVGIRIDQTLTQDSTGTMVYLEFEALGISKIKTELSLSYVDHNLLQNGFMNADDHIFLQTSASKYGVYFSRPGNGICHQVHLERFAIPGKTLLGSDSHTPTCGGIGMLAIGAGGLDVALAMAGKPFYIKMPQIVNVVVKGKLPVGEMFGMSSELRSATGGRGTSSLVDQNFERLPMELQTKIVSQIKQRKGLKE